MPVQDDQRERELCRVFNLEWDPDHQRSGVDAFFDITIDGARYRIETEVKSTTGDTVSTARDVGLDHIQRWERMLWVIGFYSQGKSALAIVRCLCLTPADMAPWINRIKEKIKPDFDIAAHESARLTLDDLHAVCGDKPAYDVEDAKRLHKQQWSAKQYSDARDVQEGRRRKISPPRMLEILQARGKYIAERGATLNNPHVTRTFLASFRHTDREILGEHAIKIRSIVESYIRANPDHHFPRLDSE